ncbi:hypothetical protein Cadr_000020259 [Camelus dromedarius]|uniref:Uncharacterized protein n=1 Tax=Camelus dromedarius TaxID=9838 RepID=A0A5N4D081_CAMDR|nr:hypothetical protein Cadr_000020259 [Camelus dromedarius]
MSPGHPKGEFLNWSVTPACSPPESGREGSELPKEAFLFTPKGRCSSSLVLAGSFLPLSTGSLECQRSPAFFLRPWLRSPHHPVGLCKQGEVCRERGIAYWSLEHGQEIKRQRGRQNQSLMGMKSTVDHQELPMQLMEEPWRASESGEMVPSSEKVRSARAGARPSWLTLHDGSHSRCLWTFCPGERDPPSRQDLLGMQPPDWREVARGLGSNPAPTARLQPPIRYSPFLSDLARGHLPRTPMSILGPWQSLQFLGNWLWGRMGRVPENSGQGPSPDIPAPPFLLLLLQEGEALGGRGRKGKQLDIQLQPLSTGPCSSPSPLWPSQGVSGATSVAWAHLPLTCVSRNQWNGKVLWEVAFPPSAGKVKTLAKGKGRRVKPGWEGAPLPLRLPPFPPTGAGSCSPTPDPWITPQQLPDGLLLTPTQLFSPGHPPAYPQPCLNHLLYETGMSLTDPNWQHYSGTRIPNPRELSHIAQRKGGGLGGRLQLRLDIWSGGPKSPCSRLRSFGASSWRRLYLSVHVVRGGGRGAEPTTKGTQQKSPPSNPIPTSNPLLSEGPEILTRACTELRSRPLAPSPTKVTRARAHSKHVGSPGSLHVHHGAGEDRPASLNVPR